MLKVGLLSGCPRVPVTPSPSPAIRRQVAASPRIAGRAQPTRFGVAHGT